MQNKFFKKLKIFSGPVLSSLVVFLVFFIGALKIETYEKENIFKTFELKSSSILKEMRLNLERFKYEIERMATRQAHFQKITQTEFLMDAKEHIKDHENLEAIELSDKFDIVKWRYPNDVGSKIIIGMELSWDKKRYDTILQAKAIKKPLISPLLNLPQGGKGFMLTAPIFKNNTYLGNVMYIFKLRDLFKKLISGDDFAVSVFEKSTLLYETGNADAAVGWDPNIESFNFYGTNWILKIYPTANFINQYQSNNKSLIIIFGLFISVFTGLVFYLQNIKNLQAQKIDEIKKRLQKFMDIQQSMVFLIDNNKIKYANKTFLNFFGYETLEEFNEQEKNIDEKFIQNDIYFHSGKVLENGYWIDEIQKYSLENQIVSLLSSTFEPEAFQVNLSHYSKHSFIVNLTNISANMKKRLEFESKATKDKLTGLHNREFFNTKINTFIQEVSNSNNNLGIIIYDIDKFKLVNDTYGHNRGDIVLKQLAKISSNSTSNNDLLVRWGGEEFIVATLVNNSKEVIELAQKIRVAIESSYFEEVEKITSSFGATIHKINDTITDTINRADGLLYHAKKNGRNRVESDC